MPGARHSLPAHVTERLVAGSFGISLAIAGFPTPPASAVMLGAARTVLAERLQRYMVPAAVVVIEALPSTPTALENDHRLPGVFSSDVRTMSMGSVAAVSKR